MGQAGAGAAAPRPEEACADRTLLRGLFDHAPGLVAVHEGPQHLFFYANPALQRRVGRVLLGRTMRDALPELQGQGIFERYDQVQRTGAPSIEKELRIAVDRGERHAPAELYFNLSLQPWLWPDGRIRGVITFALEITESVRARERLEESEARFRHLADAAPVMIWMSGPDVRATYFNQRWIAFTGRPAADQLGNGWIDAIHPEDRARCIATYRAAFHARRDYEHEYRLRRADGAWRWILNQGVPRFTRHGAFVGYVGSVIDITERRQAEQALRESEQRYRTLLECADDAIFVFTVEADGRPGRYLEVNEAACRRLGYSREELRAMTPEAVVDTGEVPYVDALATAMDELLQAGSIVVERIHLAKDGRRIPVEVSATLLDLQGKPTVIAIARDITERKQAENVLRESEERLRFTLEAAHVGTWHWDMASGRVQWSDNLEAIHGLPPGSFGGDLESFLNDVHPDDRAQVMAAIQGAAGGEGHYHIEYRLPERDGGERWVEGKGRTFCDAAGRPVRMAGVCMDVTARKQAERTRQLLLHELQHRVKNMLAVVQSLAQQTALNAGSLPEFTESFQGRLKGLAQAHDLLVKTRWEGAELEELVLAALSPWCDPARLRLSGPGVLLAPRAALTLGMVFHELATNALKYGALSRETGHVEVEWRIAPTPEGDRLALTWTEQAGPAVHAPARRGFGTELIEGSIAYELKGEARLAFDAPGLRCSIGFPLARADARPGM
jgi:PAS domain S-box-containing protein